MQNIIAIENGVTRHPLYRMKEPVNMTLAALLPPALVLERVISDGDELTVVGRQGRRSRRLRERSHLS